MNGKADVITTSGNARTGTWSARGKVKGGRGIRERKMMGREGGKRATHQERKVGCVALDIMDGFQGVSGFEYFWVVEPIVTDGKSEGCHPNHTFFNGGKFES